MQDDFNIQYAFKHLMEEIDETSTTSGVGTYHRNKGERTTGGLIYKDLWEEEGLQLGEKVYVTHPHPEQQKKFEKVNDEAKEGVVVGIEEGFVMVQMEGETGVHPVNTQYVHRVPEEYEQREGQDLEEIFKGTPQDYRDALEYIKKLEGSNPEMYNLLSDIINQAAISLYSVVSLDRGKNPRLKVASSISGEKDYALTENYSRFKNETKTRNKPDQFHQAIREVKKRVHEIHKVFEYVNRLKEELNESGELKYRRHTEQAMTKIKEMVSELNTKMKKLK